MFVCPCMYVGVYVCHCVSMCVYVCLHSRFSLKPCLGKRWGVGATRRPWAMVAPSSSGWKGTLAFGGGRGQWGGTSPSTSSGWMEEEVKWEGAIGQLGTAKRKCNLAHSPLFLFAVKSSQRQLGNARQDQVSLWEEMTLATHGSQSTYTFRQPLKLHQRQAPGARVDLGLWCPFNKATTTLHRLAVRVKKGWGMLAQVLSSNKVIPASCSMFPMCCVLLASAALQPMAALHCKLRLLGLHVWEAMCQHCQQVVVWRLSWRALGWPPPRPSWLGNSSVGQAAECGSWPLRWLPLRSSRVRGSSSPAGWQSLSNCVRSCWRLRHPLAISGSV